MMIRSRKVLNPAGAEAVMKTAEAYAKEKGYRVVIAIVDPAGNPMLLKKLPDTQVASSQVAVDKARTAAIFVRPSRVLEEQVSAGRIGALSLRGGVALTGGIPLKVGDEVVGAIGTSGETPDQDEAISVAGSQAKFEVDEVKALTYEGAQAIANAAANLAVSRGVNPVITIVDAEGQTIYIWRPDKAQVASVNVATDKARTAAIYRRPSKDFEDQVTKGRASALALARGVPLQGGMPILYRGQVIGAIGVSGASSADEDQEIAIAGAGFAEGFKETSGQAQVFYAMHKQVEAKFKTGGLLLDTDQYKVDAGRRDKPGEAEFHTHVTDIMYVLEGDAMVVTGGEMVESREVKPGEIRAKSIKGGEAHHISKGDVFVIPGGVPHQFTEVSKPFLYYVVKTIGQGA